MRSESNRSLGFFRPALLHLSYATVGGTTFLRKGGGGVAPLVPLPGVEPGEDVYKTSGGDRPHNGVEPMTGIEPANSSVQGRRGALTTSSAWFRGEGSNPQHPAPKASVLPLNYHGMKTRRGTRAGSAFRGAQADCWSTSLCRITHYLFGPVRVGDGS